MDDDGVPHEVEDSELRAEDAGESDSPTGDATGFSEDALARSLKTPAHAQSAIDLHKQLSKLLPKTAFELPAHVLPAVNFQNRLTDLMPKSAFQLPAHLLPAIDLQRLTGFLPKTAFGLPADVLSAITSQNRLADLMPALNIPALDFWHSDLIKSLGNTFAILKGLGLPPNLRGVRKFGPNDICDFLEEEGIPLYLVPRASIAKRLLKATNSQARRAILNHEFDNLVLDCESVLDRCTKAELSSELGFVRAVVSAIRDGHHRPAQALAANIVDTLLTRILPTKQMRSKVTSHASGDARALDDLEVRTAYVMLPVWRAHKNFRAHRGDRVPHVFSRHASVHAVSYRQFNKRNTIQGLMLATSLLGYANDL